MSEKYDHKSMEKKWQDKWDKDEIYKTPVKPNSSKKRYILDMFPYPSGAGLHVGHPEGYTATDIYSRFLRMNGFDVLHPMGWDAFGLPAENYAIKAKIHPDESTKKNILRFREQIKSLGLSYDWSREINTSDPDYYKWTQWLFIKLFEKGLAYKKEASVNWCLSCQTVLANEQVVTGECERCGTKVVQKMLSQWFFKITDYADRLLTDAEKLDWPEPIKLMQKNWIGKSEGAEIEFSVKKNYNFLILHGFKSKPTDTFYPWLKKGLEKVGYKVQMPGLPDPAEEKWVDTVLRECRIDENTVIVGHSLGAVVGMKVIEKLNHKITGLVMAGGFAVPKFKDKHRSLEETFNWDIDFKKIKNNVGFVKIIVDKNDHVVPEDQGYLLKKELGGELIITNAEKPHFNGLEEPAILEATFFSIKVFTTRPDTIFGATYMVLAPEHPLVQQIVTPEQKNYVDDYVIKAKGKTELQRTALEKEKTGVFTGAYAINPATNKEIPIWIADYVIMNYGTGAIMAVPAHDQRDFEFAKKYKLPIKIVIKGGEKDKVFVGSGEVVNSGKFNGLKSEEAVSKMAIEFGKPKIQYKLRDWLVSRQRYWGAPIPIVYCDKCGMQAVPESELPVKLPTDVDFQPTGESPLTRSEEFNKGVKCPRCGESAKRDVDTMDTFVDSSWYFFRFTDPFNKKEFASKKEISKWLPVDLYVGGAEHAVMHLLYARFLTKALADFGYLYFSEPFLKLRNQGLILGPDGEKMSKSRGNVINPDDIIVEFGADVLRVYEMFMGPLEDAKPWDTKSIVGVRRFLDRVYKFNSVVIASGAPVLPSERDAGKQPNQEIVAPTASAYKDGPAIHKLIKKITEDIEQFKFNTAIAAFMEFLNENKELSKKDWETFLKLLAPFAPHTAEEMWHELGNNESIHLAEWPKFDPKKTKDDTVIIAVQILGRLRGTITMDAGAKTDDVKLAALNDERVKKHLEGKEIVKVIVVPDKLINFVTR